MYKLYLDSDGRIVQANGDGGDCAARTGEYYCGLKIRDSLNVSNFNWPKTEPTDWLADRDALIMNDGTVLRYTRIPYNNFWDVSRDQTMPMIMAVILEGDKQTFVNMWNKISYATYRFQNHDICGPQEFAIFARGFRHFGLEMPAMCRDFEKAGDWQLLFGSLLRCIKGLKADDVGDDINLTIQHAFIKRIHDTKVTKLARWLYVKLRPRGIQYAFDWYHRPAAGGNPLNELWRPIISTLI